MDKGTYSGDIGEDGDLEGLGGGDGGNGHLSHRGGPGGEEASSEHGHLGSDIHGSGVYLKWAGRGVATIRD